MSSTSQSKQKLAQIVCNAKDMPRHATDMLGPASIHLRLHTQASKLLVLGNLVFP